MKKYIININLYLKYNCKIFFPILLYFTKYTFAIIHIYILLNYILRKNLRAVKIIIKINTSKVPIYRHTWGTKNDDIRPTFLFEERICTFIKFPVESVQILSQVTVRNFYQTLFKLQLYTYTKQTSTRFKPDLKRRKKMANRL